MKPNVEVVAGVIRRADRCLLISLRPNSADQGGLWEFPGGKREPGEGRFEALRRELNEELGIKMTHACPLLRLRHQYPTKLVDLDVWEVLGWDGVECGREGQRIAWVSPDELHHYDFPAANQSISLAVQLPRLLIEIPSMPATDRITAWLEFDIGFIIPSSHAFGHERLSKSIVLTNSVEFQYYSSQQNIPGLIDANNTQATSAPVAVRCRSLSDLRLASSRSVDVAVMDDDYWHGPNSDESVANRDVMIDFTQRFATPSYLATDQLSDIVGAISSGFHGLVLGSHYLDKDPVATARELKKLLDRVSTTCTD